MAKKLDLLTQKQGKLNTYNFLFDKAVSVVKATVDSLKSINDEISQSIQEIDDYQAELSTTRAELQTTMEKNEQVKKNFEALLSIE